jgi:hypothetical protein
MNFSSTRVALIAGAAFAAGAAVAATVVAATGSSDPQDPVVAAPANHKALYEDDHIRLLEVTVEPGETEKVHRHRYPSAIVGDGPAPLRSDYSPGDKTTLNMEPMFEGASWATPQCEVLPAGPAHQLTDRGKYPLHFYRLEFNSNAWMEMTS